MGKDIVIYDKYTRIIYGIITDTELRRKGAINNK